MDLPQPDIPDSPTQRKRDRARLLRAFNASLALVLVLTAVFFAQSGFDFRAFTVMPHSAAGLLGLFTAPLLHGDLAHLAMNAIAILMLGTLAGSVFPRASLRALPLLWLGSGLAAWTLGAAGEHHLGASGVTHGLMFMVFVLGLLRRDRAAVAAGMLAFMFYGGMLMSVLPREAGVSWQSHLGGALSGVLAAWLFRRADPRPPRRRYSWELEEDAEDEHTPASALEDPLEPARPEQVPVIWQREVPPTTAQILPFRRDGKSPPNASP